MGCSPSGPGDLSVCSFCSFSNTNSVLKHMVSFQVVLFRNCWYTGQIFYCVYFFRCFVTSDYMVYYSRGLLYFRIKYIYSFKQFTSTSIQCIVPIVHCPTITSVYHTVMQSALAASDRPTDALYSLYAVYRFSHLFSMQPARLRTRLAYEHAVF